MMETQTVTHVTVGNKHEVQFEQAASTKGVLGFKIKSQGDDLEQVMADAKKLLDQAKQVAPAPQAGEGK